MKYIKILICTLFLPFLLACGSKLLTVHKIDVQQGNALDAEMVDKVEIGMSQEQVQYVLGSPLITDSFHPDRWDYIFLFTPGYGDVERRQLTLIFDRGEVIKIDKHNIVQDDTLEIAEDQPEETQDEEENLSEKEKQELEEAEKQADSLKDVLQENKNPGN